MFKKGYLLIVVLLLFVTSCYNANYRNAFKTWTARDNVYNFSDFRVDLMWRATYLSPDFRLAAKGYLDELMKEVGDNFNNYPDYLSDNDVGSFIIAIYVPKNYPSLTSNNNKFWEFELDLASGEVVYPKSIETISVTPRESKLFPYVNRWSTLYRVKFPVYDLNQPFSLVLRSAGATSILDWK